MLTSIIGYPRVGSLRELKFSTEKYFRKEITADVLQQTAKNIRKEQWEFLKNSGLDFIPSNDFSFYDNVLDAAYFFNIVPVRYKQLGLSELDTYFAMARGYQDMGGDVKALAMKKWFNTNYHYMVPEIDDATEIKLAGTKPFDEYREARELGIQTKPVIIGAFTLLKLLRYTGTKNAEDFADEIIKVYSDYLREFGGMGAEWVQFDEPYLAHDLSGADISLFEKLYQGILEEKGGLKVLLQTYFGDVRDIYSQMAELPFDAVGLDFVEGKQTVSLIRKNGFPTDRLLFAGVINGKNIWRNDYKKTLSLLDELTEKGIRTVISTSCSLLHVPYTLNHESKLPKEYIKHFSFAQEKLGELAELKELSNNKEYRKEEKFLNNVSLFDGRADCKDNTVQNRVREIKESDFTRLPSFAERKKYRKRNFIFRFFLRLQSALFRRPPM